MLSPELIKKIRRLEISTKRVVNTVFAGQYQSAFRGKGMEFSEVREYQPGDDIRSIDWNVTARLGAAYIKKFTEERELTVMLMVDASSSGNFGTRRLMKGEIAVNICAMLAFSAIKNNDRVGLVIFTDRIEKFIPPEKGRRHVLRVIRELLFFKPQAQQTNLVSAIEYLHRSIKKRSVLFLVSDFITGDDFLKPLRILKQKHDVVAISVTDPREVDMPDVGFIELEDAETGEEILVDTASRGFRETYGRLNRKAVEARQQNFQRMGIDFIPIFTDQDYVDPIIAFFHRRERKR
jgi:uncharacterized protein (DUF58 family)